MDFASSTRAAEDNTRWNGIVVKSSVVSRRPRKVHGIVSTRLVAGLGLIRPIQSNFNGSNTFGTMKISSRQG